MRVITGTARGRRLISPEGLNVRPSTDRVKEAIFSIVQFHVAGARVLDVCAGSGQLGIEALSRDAKSAVFIENSRRNCFIIKENLKLTGLEDKAKVVCEDALRYLASTRESYDIIIADPPYRIGLAAMLLPLMERVLNRKGFIIIETEGKCELPEECGNLKLKKKYKHCKTDLWMYRRSEELE